MSLIFIDGFDHYGDDADPFHLELNKKWSSNYNASINTDNPRRTGGRHLRLGFPSGNISKYLDSVKNTLAIGFAHKILGYPSTGQPFVQFNRMGGITLYITIEADGSLAVRRGEYYGTIIAQSDPAIIPINAWYYFEIKVLISNTVGTYEIKVQGVTVLSGSGVDTQGATTSGIDRLILFHTGGVSYSYLDDLYVDDTDLHGDCRIDPLWPKGAGMNTGWTPLSGGNFENVDELHDIDDDTTYVETDVVDRIDTYDFDDLPEIEDTSIVAIALNLCVRKTDAGTRKYKHVCEMIDILPDPPTGTIYLGPEKDFHDSYLVKQKIWEGSPADPGTPMTRDELNNAEFGIKLTE